MQIEEKLAQLGLSIPQPKSHTSAYRRWYQAGSLLFLPGMPPVSEDGSFAFVGKVGRELSKEEGKASARLSFLNALFYLREAVSRDWDRVLGCAKMVAYVHCDPSFSEVHEVADAASLLALELFGDSGPVRTSLGCASLPANVATEIELIFHVT
jgi:enamine deaminase RidA (YjgF/YER057c/UK114 family)